MNLFLFGFWAKLEGFGWIMLTGGGGIISSNSSESENIKEDGIQRGLNVIVQPHSKQ